MKVWPHYNINKHTKEGVDILNNMLHRWVISLISKYHNRRFKKVSNAWTLVSDPDRNTDEDELAVAKKEGVKKNPYYPPSSKKETF